MKIQLLIAVSESDYAEHLSRVLTEKSACGLTRWMPCCRR